MNLFSYSKQTALLAFPILGAHLIEALIPFINTTMAASLGELSLASAGLVGTTFFAIMGFCWGTIASVGILTANKIGEAKEQDKIGLILWSGFITSFVLSIPVTILFLHMQSIWLYLGQDSQVALVAQQYMNGLALAVPADLAKFAIFQYAIACNKSRVPLIGNIISVPLLVVLNNYLTNQYGIYGIGLGTALTYWLVFAGMLLYLLSSNHFRSDLLQAHSTSKYIKSCIEQLRLGVPIGLMFSIELLFFMVFALQMGHISSATLAANQIAMQWMFFTIMIAYGFTEAVTILVAKANGAGETQSMKQFTIVGIFLSSITTFIIACVYWFFPQSIIAIDLSSQHSAPSLVILATKMLMFCGVYQVLDCVRIVIAGALRGMNDTQYPMWVAVISFWMIALPVGYVCAFVLNLQETGLWIGLIFAVIINVTLQSHRMQQKNIVIAEATNAMAA